MKTASADIVELLTCPYNDAYVEGDVSSSPATTLTFEQGGIVGDRHFGKTLAAGPRQMYVPAQLKLPNLRQVSIVAAEELQQIANILGVEQVTGADLGANIVISGAPNLTSFPAGINGVISFGGSDALLYATGENEPCAGPGRAITKRTGTDVSSRFAKAALHRRGIVAMVGRPGIIDVGQRVTLHYPAWTGWKPERNQEIVSPGYAGDADDQEWQG